MTRNKVLTLFRNIPSRVGSNMFYKVLTSVYLFDFLDRMCSTGYPGEWYSILEKELDGLISGFGSFDKTFDFSMNDFESWSVGAKEERFDKRTGKVYSDLWKDFGKKEFFAQALGNLKERLDKNGIDISSVKDALDDGCGSGRYSFALKSLGCGRVKGVDISSEALELARKMNPFSAKEVSFEEGSVLELPADDKSFDFVFSNGVLHHTTDIAKGLREIFRVLDDGGSCWLYLYGGKESLFWDIVDICRSLLAHVPQEYTQSLMRNMGYPPGRIFHRADFFYVPVNNRYFASEVESMLRAAGFKKFKRLRRGAAHDWDEIIHGNPDIDPYIFGEGEMRYLVNK